MRRNVLFDMIVEDIVLCGGSCELGAYDVELVHNREPERAKPGNSNQLVKNIEADLVSRYCRRHARRLS